MQLITSDGQSQYVGFQDRLFQPPTHPAAESTFPGELPNASLQQPLRSSARWLLAARCEEDRGVKLHHFAEMRHEVGEAVVARIRVIFMLYPLLQQLVVKHRRTLLKAVIVLLAAVEINRQFA